MKLQDLDLYELEEIDYKISNTPNLTVDDWKDMIPELILNLARNKKDPIITGLGAYRLREDILKMDYPCTTKGIKQLIELAEEGDPASMFVLSEYFYKQGEPYVNEWCRKGRLQMRAEEVVVEERRRARMQNSGYSTQHGCRLPKGLMKG